MQVLSNLLGNALKFTPEGGHIGVRAESEGEGAVRVSVVDTGPGISAEDVPHLFDPFWQSKDGAALGTGLGLAIARGIVEAHGGTISVDSSPGEGSTFTFTLLVASVPATVDRLDGAGGGLG
jgi:signal transduction histidine kinase